MRALSTIGENEIDQWTPKTFERIVALGRSIQHLREHDARLYRASILDACLHNKAYDTQIGGDRAEYALDSMRSSGDLPFYPDETISPEWESARSSGDVLGIPSEADIDE